MYLNINKRNGYIEDHNGNRYLLLSHNDESKDALKKYKKLRKKIKNLIRSINNNSDDYDEQYMEIKFNSYDDLSLKTLELRYIKIIVTSVFLDAYKYYS